MPTNDLSKNYSTTPLPGNPRATEAWALSQAALRLREARENGDREQRLAAARLNWRLWTILQSDLLDTECPVPSEIRVNMLTLARFIDQRTVDFLSAPEAEKLDVLISINRHISAGLFSNPGAAPHPDQTTAAIGETGGAVRIST